LEHYQRHVGPRHLDVGVGTGYYLDRVAFPGGALAITLFDLNAESLAHTARRIARYSPVAVEGDVLEPNRLADGAFDSVGLGFLLHCLPAGGVGKWRALDQLGPKLAPGGTLFGSTILGSSPPLRRQRLLMGAYNRRGIFDNGGDDLERLRGELRARFEDVAVEVEGVVALFTARQWRPKTEGSKEPSRELSSELDGSL
ncbi:MAG TPA: class I SAM-dependent methyltransferase, partial [Polyangiaceae bacterium]|nr:class I SAM-dependent methyltransferase [Polyangiaceae bacterium]